MWKVSEMNHPGYTILHQPHICPKPDNVPAKTRIRCDECGWIWERSLFGWARIGTPEDDR